MRLATLNVNGLRGSDLRAAAKGAPTPKVEALLSFIRQHQVVAMQDCVGMDELALQQLLSPTHVLQWTRPQHSNKGRAWPLQWSRASQRCAHPSDQQHMGGLRG